ncbi:hypothetical protein E4T48_00793, partial [Aureobasidium sp. EXF-10727]
LHSSTSDIRELISRHLRIPETDFVLHEPSDWIAGGFNICLPIDVDNRRHPQLPPGAVVRFPLPFNVGEGSAPGTVDEKLRCEAATYIWLRGNCPNIPLPRLLGMGFSGSQSFTSIENETFINRLRWLSATGMGRAERCFQAIGKLKLYKRCYDDFVYVLEQEEMTVSLTHSYSKRLRGERLTGRIWYVMALSTINAFPGIFEQHLQPRFFAAGFRLHVQGAMLSRLWCEDVDLFVAKKLEDYEAYKKDVRGVFAAAAGLEDIECAGKGDGQMKEGETSVDVHEGTHGSCVIVVNSSVTMFTSGMIAPIFVYA